MNRFTYELGHKGSGAYEPNRRKDMPVNDYINCVNQLGRIEDVLEEFCVNDNQDLRKRLEESDTLGELQEKLGIKLTIAFEALNGIYTSESDFDPHYEMFEVRGIDKNGIIVISKLCNYAECDFTRKWSDYKNTWWLKPDRSE